MKKQGVKWKPDGLAELDIAESILNAVAISWWAKSFWHKGLPEWRVEQGIQNQNTGMILPTNLYKKIRSTNPNKKKAKEYLYIIQSPNLDGIAIYTKGKLVREGARGGRRYLLFSGFIEKGAVRERESNDKNNDMSDLWQQQNQEGAPSLDRQS